MSNIKMNIGNIVNEYLAKGDISNENSNMSFGPSSLLLVSGEEVLKRDYLHRIEESGYEKLSEWHKKGKIHIHDLGLGFNVPYCAGNSLINLMSDGIETSSIKSGPAKHFSSIINHMVNFIGSSSNDFAGAQAFNDIDLYLSPYAYKTYLDYKKMGCSKNLAFQLTRKIIYQEIQSFVFHLNYNTRWGGQAPFSNISLSIVVPEDIKNQLAMVGGKLIAEYFDFKKDGVEVKHHTYGELQKWQDLIVDAILDVFIEGDEEGKSFTFPVLTINVTEDFFKYDVSKKIFELTAKFGTPFFQNYINGVSGGKKTNPSDSRSMCCFSGEETIEVWNKKTKMKENYNIDTFVNMFIDKDIDENINAIYVSIENEYKIISFNGKKTDNTSIISVLKKRNTYGKLLEIKVSGKKIKVTPDHEFMVKDKLSAEIKKVNADYLMNNKEKYFLPLYFNDVQWKNIEYINETPHNGCVYDIELKKDHYFPANGIISHNCRLHLDIAELKAHTGGLFGNADNTGSLQVITVNLPYIIKELQIKNGNITLENIFNEIDFVMEEIKNEQLWKRKIINEYFNKGYYVLAKQNFKRGFNTFFTTIGFIGLWEAVEMFIDDENSFLTDTGLDIAEAILNRMNSNCSKYIVETGKLFNLEATPAEGATYKLAKKSLKHFPDIKHRGKKKSPYFTNSCHIPVEFQDKLHLIFKTQNRLQTIPTGGTVTHFNVGEKLSPLDVKNIIKTICQSKIPFFSINLTFTFCPICGYKVGVHEVCPNDHTEEELLELYKKSPEKFIFD